MLIHNYHGTIYGTAADARRWFLERADAALKTPTARAELKRRGTRNEPTSTAPNWASADAFRALEIARADAVRAGRG